MKQYFNSIKQFQLIPINQKFTSTIGKGSAGKVYAAKHKINNNVYAVKKIFPASDFIHQAKIQIQLDHPNIVKLYDFFIENDNLYLVLEYVKGQNLFNAIKDGLSKQRQFVIFSQICEVISYLHQRNIIHRDIKVVFTNQPQNILLDKNNKPKLCDFGWSVIEPSQRQTFCGTYQYMAPQIIKGKAYSNKVDIWALGILLYEMRYRKAPFQSRKSAKQVYQKMKNGIFFNPYQNADFATLVFNILKMKPYLRPNIVQIINSPYMKNNNKKRVNQLKTTINQIKLQTSQDNKNIKQGFIENCYQLCINLGCKTQIQKYSQSTQQTRKTNNF